MNNDFEIYVVYKNGKPYIRKTRKRCYFRIESAKAVIESECKRDGHIMYSNYCKKNNIQYIWYDLCKEQKEFWYNEARKLYEIKVFTEKKA